MKKSVAGKKKVFATRSNLRWLLLLPVLFTAIFYWPELTQHPLEVNDESFHLTLIKGAINEIEAGGNPLDFWLPIWTGGMAMFTSYQHFPHLFTVGLYYLFGKQIPVEFWFHFMMWLLMSLWPLSLYKGMRWLEIGETAAIMAAVAAPALCGQGSYGLGVDSYIYIGWGMWAQLWGQFFLPLALGYAWQVIARGRKYWPGVLLGSITMLSHVLFGYILVFSGIIMVLLRLDWRTIYHRSIRYVALFALVGVVCSYFVLPMFTDSPYRAISKWDQMEKRDGYGHVLALTKLFNGDTFDKGYGKSHFPFLFMSVLFGLVICLAYREEPHRIVLISFVVWLLLWFGRPTWGGLLDLLPFTKDLHFERLVTAVHLFGLMAIGIALAEAISWVSGQKWRYAPFLAALVPIAVLSVPYLDRENYARENANYIKDYTIKQKAPLAEAMPIFNYLRGATDGRVWPGPPGGWGKNVRVGQAEMYHVLSQNYISTIGYMTMTWSLVCDFQGMTALYENRRPWFDLMNLRYWLTLTGFGPGEPCDTVMTSGKYILYKIPTGGWFDLVEAPYLVKGDRTNVWKILGLWQQSDLLERKRFMVVDFRDNEKPTDYRDAIWMRGLNKYATQPDGLVQDLFGATPNWFQPTDTTLPLGTVDDRSTDGRTYLARVKAERDAFVVLKQSFHPNWRMQLDGRDVPTVMLSPGLVGIRVPAGEHEVRAYYHPHAEKIPLAILGFFVLAGLAVYEQRFRRKKGGKT